MLFQVVAALKSQLMLRILKICHSPTKEAVKDLNTLHQRTWEACYQIPEAKKASKEHAEILQKEILLAEGAKDMITRNVWTSKGLVNSAQGIVKKIWWYLPGSDV
ncbi:hypothetical protein DFH07DRAFT_768129 [Mycena maculata]|uniref:Uncharacterized protein n=1 Tax=Mycena maculata TaxID=230809 RepID=A0AAD7NRD0_9AGAR|nr:hypothetical protein DFH07DRAFT_768129 [Mycena maculata]